MICPKCRSRATGRIGHNQYYCWDCNIEFISTKDGFRTFRLEEDGTSIPDTPEGDAHISLASGADDAQVNSNVLSGGPPAGGPVVEKTASETILRQIP